MKQNYFRTLLASFSMLISICANAYDAYIDGIYYNFHGDEAEVTNLGITGSYSMRFVDIPDHVYYGWDSYTVTSIGREAFKDCSDIQVLDIPSSVTSIGSDAFSGCSGLTRINISD